MPTFSPSAVLRWVSAAHLVDHVIPQAPVRQWVLSLPKRLRGFLHYDPVVAGKVLRILLQEIGAASKAAIQQVKVLPCQLLVSDT